MHFGNWKDRPLYYHVVWSVVSKLLFSMCIWVKTFIQTCQWFLSRIWFQFIPIFSCRNKKRTEQNFGCFPVSGNDYVINMAFCEETSAKKKLLLTQFLVIETMKLESVKDSFLFKFYFGKCLCVIWKRISSNKLFTFRSRLARNHRKLERCCRFDLHENILTLFWHNLNL